MKLLLQTFGQLLQLKNGPQALPYAPSMTLVSMLLLILLPLMLAFGKTNSWNIFISSLVTHGFTFLATYIVLMLYHKPARFMQTALALAGCLLLLNVIILLISSLISMLVVNLGFAPKPFIFMILLLGSCWMLLVQGNIYRHALDVRFGIGILVTLVIAIVLATLLKLLKVVGGA